MGEMGALRVRQQHCAAVEAEKLRSLFFADSNPGNASQPLPTGTLRNLNGPQGLRNRKNLATGN
jgi:hypothetical protein